MQNKTPARHLDVEAGINCADCRERLPDTFCSSVYRRAFVVKLVGKAIPTEHNRLTKPVNPHQSAYHFGPQWRGEPRSRGPDHPFRLNTPAWASCSLRKPVIVRRLPSGRTSST